MANLGNLFAFESAARHQSFTKDYKELGISQSAVSQKVRSLEEALGSALFARVGRSVALTRAGERLCRDVTFAIQALDRAVQVAAPDAAPGPVTLSASTAFAAWGMAPRLGRFQAACPEIDLRLQTTDRDVDIVAEGISLGVRAGEGAVDGCECTLLCPEVIYPVCAPTWLDGHPPLESPADLLGQPLIHLEEPHRPATTWDDWLRHHGVTVSCRIPGLRINDYALVLQAVLQGGGIALGWQHLVQPLIAQGLLCRPLDAEMRTGQGFYVIQPRLRRRGDPANRVREWMLAQPA